MSSIPKEQVAKALASIVREALAQRREEYVPGLGTFSVQHHPSRLESTPSGETIVHPPRDEVAFVPES